VIDREEIAVQFFINMLNNNAKNHGTSLESHTDYMMLQAFRLADKIVDMRGKTTDELEVLLKMRHQDEPRIVSTGISTTTTGFLGVASGSITATVFHNGVASGNILAANTINTWLNTVPAPLGYGPATP
jgi:predicted TIM-barrel enzyme